MVVKYNNIYGLTDRELELLACIVDDGMTQIQVARMWQVKPKSINTCMRTVYSKLDLPAPNSISQVRAFWRNGQRV